MPIAGKATTSLLRLAADAAIQKGDVTTAAKLLELLTREEERIRKRDADRVRVKKEERIEALKVELGEKK